MPRAQALTTFQRGYYTDAIVAFEHLNPSTGSQPTCRSHTLASPLRALRMSSKNGYTQLQCAEGYSGVLCGQCIRNSTH